MSRLMVRYRLLSYRLRAEGCILRLGDNPSTRILELRE